MLNLNPYFAYYFINARNFYLAFIFTSCAYFKNGQNLFLSKLQNIYFFFNFEIGELYF